jgi:transcriptional regulator with XRE-family HTH domain
MAQKELAHELGLPLRRLSWIERGVDPFPAELGASMASALGLPDDYFDLEPERGAQSPLTGVALPRDIASS